MTERTDKAKELLPRIIEIAESDLLKARDSLYRAMEVGIVADEQNKVRFIANIYNDLEENIVLFQNLTKKVELK